MEITLIRSDFAEPLVTAEDYDKACKQFVLPYCKQQADIIAVCLEELQSLVDLSKPIDLEKAKGIQDDIRFAAEFSDSAIGGPIYNFMQEVAALETTLEEQGVFADEEPS